MEEDEYIERRKEKPSKPYLSSQFYIFWTPSLRWSGVSKVEEGPKV